MVSGKSHGADADCAGDARGEVTASSSAHDCGTGVRAKKIGPAQVSYVVGDGNEAVNE